MNNKIPAVEKTILLLERLAKTSAGATQAELKRELNISMSTAYRILQTLLRHKWVRKDTGGTYLLDNGLLPLLYQFRASMELLDHAQPVIRRLAEEQEIACKLSIRRGLEQVTVMRAEPSGPFALTGQIGSSFPLIEGSVGAALLSGDTDEDILSIAEDCGGDLPEHQNPSLILDAVHEIREKGYALNLRKNRWNIAAISIPVHDANGSIVAALTLIGTESDFSGEKLKKQIRILKDAARQCGDDSSPKEKARV